MTPFIHKNLFYSGPTSKQHFLTFYFFNIGRIKQSGLLFMVTERTVR